MTIQLIPKPDAPEDRFRVKKGKQVSMYDYRYLINKTEREKALQGILNRGNPLK